MSVTLDEMSHAAEHTHKAPEPYWNPYLSGIGLGLVLLLSYVIMGRGLGASGAMTTTAAVAVNAVAPEYAQSNEFYSEYLGDGTKSPFKDWLVFEVIGVLVGGFLSGALAGRIKMRVEKGPRISVRYRLIFAFAGVCSWASARNWLVAARADKP